MKISVKKKKISLTHWMHIMHLWLQWHKYIFTRNMFPTYILPDKDDSNYADESLIVSFCIDSLLLSKILLNITLLDIINGTTTLVKRVAWYRMGDMPLSELMIAESVSICGTWPRSVNMYTGNREIVIMTMLSSLMPPYVVIKTASSASSDDKVGIMRIRNLPNIYSSQDINIIQIHFTNQKKVYATFTC